jgi:hypothetical protein
MPLIKRRRGSFGAIVLPPFALASIREVISATGDPAMPANREDAPAALPFALPGVQMAAIPSTR